MQTFRLGAPGVGPNSQINSPLSENVQAFPFGGPDRRGAVVLVGRGAVRDNTPTMSTLTDLQRDSLGRHLRKHLAGEVRFDTTSRRLYSTDASLYQVEPLGVVIPRTVGDLVATVQIAAEARVALTARGGGTSLSGQSIGPGVVLDCSKYLHAILDVDPAARVARVQPSVVLDALNRAAAVHDLQFGPDVSTSSRANLGGMDGGVLNAQGGGPQVLPGQGWVRADLACFSAVVRSRQPAN